MLVHVYMLNLHSTNIIECPVSDDGVLYNVYIISMTCATCNIPS